MKDSKIQLDVTGKAVAQNVQLFRNSRGFNFGQLARRMAELGRPLSITSLQRIEEGTRRVDVDDLMYLTTALGLPSMTWLLRSEEAQIQILRNSPRMPLEAKRLIVKELSEQIAAEEREREGESDGEH